MPVASQDVIVSEDSLKNENKHRLWLSSMKMHLTLNGSGSDKICKGSDVSLVRFR